MQRELQQVGEGVLRRDGARFCGDVEAFGLALEVTGEVAEDDQGRHFRLPFYWRGLPVPARRPAGGGT